jgi:putative peptidoglycan lipid II flippase
MEQTSTPVARKTPRISIGSVAALLMVSSLSGQVLGFLRTKLVNANFLPTGPQSTDAYFAAFNIPDFFFFTVAAGALGVAFMPVLADHLHRGDRRSMWDISSSLLNLLAIIMAVVGVIIFIFARPLVQYIVAPNMTPAQLDTTELIMRFIAFNPLLFTIAGILTSMQQTLGRFFFYAIGPLFYNIAIIISIYVFRHNIGLVGLGIGAFVGALLQLAVAVTGMTNLRFKYQPRIRWRSADFRLILRQLPPRSLDQGIDQLESIVETHFARQLGSGFISYYNNAYILSTAPILLIGTAISTAAFPRLNARLSQGRPDLFRRDFLRVLRAMIWIALPIVIVVFFARGYLARLIYTRGVAEISLILGYMTASIFFGIIFTLISRWFYSQKDTRTPLIVSVFAIALNIVLVYLLAQPSAYGVVGLALAQSIVTSLQVAVLGTIMIIRDPQLLDKEFLGGLWRIISVSGFTLVMGYVAVSIYPLGLEDRGFFVLGGKLLFITLTVFVTHIILSAVYRLEEVRPLISGAKRLIAKPLRIDTF